MLSEAWLAGWLLAAGVAGPAERSAALAPLFVELEQNVPRPEAKLRGLWLAHLIGGAPEDHRRILSLASAVNHPEARMMVEVYRFDERFKKEIGRDHAVASKALMKLLHGGVASANYKDLPPNGYDSAFQFDGWEDPNGIVGRYEGGAGVLDLAAYPFGTFSGLWRPHGGGEVRVAGFLQGDRARVAAPGFAAEIGRGDGKAQWRNAQVALKRVPVGKDAGVERPADAVVLFDGTGQEAFLRPKWKIVDGALEIIKAGGLLTKESFGDVRLHVGFRQAYNDATVAGRRGNSGILLMNFYELALSDNFGSPPHAKANGGIYGVAAPRVNASAPPLEWQTLLIDFRAPRFGADGKKLENARFTVRHNGIVIHEGLEIARPYDQKRAEPTTAAPVQLQEHGSRLQFRDIWAQRLQEGRIGE